MILNEEEYTELVKDFNSIIQKDQTDAVEQVKVLELKYWKFVKEKTFFRYLVKSKNLDKVLWLLIAIIDTKKELEKMQPTNKFYKTSQKDIKDWQQELFRYWNDYDPNRKISDFTSEMKKSKWTFLVCGMNLYNNFTEKIYTFF